METCITTLPIHLNTGEPAFGVNYGSGWIGFINNCDCVSRLIDYCEHRDRHGLPIVCHTFVVESAHTCIEAVPTGGVVRSDLNKYFDAPRIHTYFRRPKQMTYKVASQIVDAATSKLGCPYDRGLIISEFLADTLLGRMVNKLLSDWPHRFVAGLIGDKTDYICSELVAYTLATQPEYKMQGILMDDLDTIDPMDLFTDQTIFDPFINDCSKHENPIPNP